ncbi:MAG: phage portal protein [Thermoplasmatales archaeon]
MSENEKKPGNKQKKTYKKVRFSADKTTDTGQDQAPNLDSLTKSISQNLQADRLKSSADLNKAIKPLTVKKELVGKLDKNKVTFNSRDLYNSIDNIEQKGWRRMSDAECREIAQVDPYISAIISTRASQGAVIGRPSESKFDKGTRVAEIKPIDYKSFSTDKEYQQAVERRQRQMDAILNWFQTCGTTNEDILNHAFDGSSDTTFKHCNMAEFVSAQIRNLLTFGRMGTQIFRDESDTIIMFRPVPIETIFPVAPGYPIHITEEHETSEESIKDAADYNKLTKKERPPAWVQRFEGRNVNLYTERDLKVSYFQKQALFDLNGYPLAPIEQAIFMVFVHQQTLGYLRNQYVKGMAAKGVISLEATTPAGQLSDEDLEQLRRDFHNYITRNDNSAALPIISGPVKVSFVPMSTNPNDMQFLQLEEHIVRALCSAFQVSPQEMGYGHLSIGQGGLTQSNKQEEIIRGEERGLRMLLDVVFDLLNEILWENFPEAKKLYRLQYTGVGDDTRDSVIARGIQELQTTATLASLWADSEKTGVVPFGGNAPLSPQFNQFVVPKMKMGQYMEYFLGEEGASKKPEYDFFIDPAINQSYQQLRVQPISVQQEQIKLGLVQQEMQMEQIQAQTEAIEQQAQSVQQQESPGQPVSEQEEGVQLSQEERPAQPAEKSLKDAFLEKQRLQKSIKTYFSEWIEANKDLEKKN